MSTGKNLILKPDGSIGRIGADVLFRNGDEKAYRCCQFTILGSGRYKEETIEWPDGYWRRVSSPCLRLLIWCNAEHDDDTYLVDQPDYIYRLVNNPNNAVSGKPIVWNCCGEEFVISDRVDGNGDSDIEYAPTGDNLFDMLEDTNYFDDLSCGRVNAGDKHLVWAIVETFHAIAEERVIPRQDGERLRLGFAHAKYVSAGIIREVCGCEFDCSDG